MYTEIQSENLIAATRKIRIKIYAPLQWINSTRQAVARQVASDVSIVAAFVAVRQFNKLLSPRQCGLLGDILNELDFDNEVAAHSMAYDYERSYKNISAITDAQVPTIRLSIFRKCDTTFGTDYTHSYQKYLNEIIQEFLKLSDSLDAEQQDLCAREFEVLLNQISFGYLSECGDFEGRVALAESLNKKMARLSLSALKHLELNSDFEWLDFRDSAIEYVLQSLALEVISLSTENQQARLEFLETLSPTVGVFGTKTVRASRLAQMLSDERLLVAASERPAWVELIAFANKTGEPELKTTALNLLCEFGAALINACGNSSNEAEANWRATVLEALEEAARRSAAMDLLERESDAAGELLE